MRTIIDYVNIKKTLDRLHDIHQPNISSDPIYFPKRFQDKQDQEIVALISALYAFGNVKMIFNTLENIFSFLGPHPYQKIISLKESELKPVKLVQHRWVTPQDTKTFLLLIQKVLKKDSTLERSFMQFYRPGDETLEQSTIDWMNFLKTTLIGMQNKPLTRGQKFLLSSPDGKSTSKRILMFFRWMVRTEEPDLGLWTKISPSKLLMPLDGHLFRFSQYLVLQNENNMDGRPSWNPRDIFRKSLIRIPSDTILPWLDLESSIYVFIKSNPKLATPV